MHFVKNNNNKMNLNIVTALKFLTLIFLKYVRLLNKQKKRWRWMQHQGGKRRRKAVIDYQSHDTVSLNPPIAHVIPMLLGRKQAQQQGRPCSRAHGEAEIWTWVYLISNSILTPHLTLALPAMTSVLLNMSFRLSVLLLRLPLASYSRVTNTRLNNTFNFLI